MAGVGAAGVYQGGGGCVVAYAMCDVDPGMCSDRGMHLNPPPPLITPPMVVALRIG